MTVAPSVSPPLVDVSWPFVAVFTRLGMSVGLGVFIGLEREHHQKAGVRTFALTALLGGLAGLMGDLYAITFLGFVAMAVAFMNVRQLRKGQKLALTTSTALTITGFCGVLFGQGHQFAPASAGIVTAALLAWKQPISRFVVGLTQKELRSAILLAILSIVILPVLPEAPVDPWHLIDLRSTWGSVVLIAGIGFINYILLKVLGPRGMEVTAFFGGLVNSRKVVVELAYRVRELGRVFAPMLHRGMLLASIAMILRNGVVAALLAPAAALQLCLPLGSMLAAGGLLWWRNSRQKPAQENDQPGELALESPFRLPAALKFGAVFLLLNVLGGLAQRQFGSGSFYFVSMLGGLLSSASSIAAGAHLIARGELPVTTGVNGIVLSSIVSILANIPLLRGMGQEGAPLRKAVLQLSSIAAAGLAGMGAAMLLPGA